MDAGQLVGRASTRHRAAALAAALAACAAARLADPAGLEAMPVLCPFRALTGLPCPGCGMTRALVALADADLAASLAYHPLAPAVALAALVAVGWYAWRGRAPRVADGVAASAVALVVAVWLTRLLPLLAERLGLLA